MWKTVAAGVIAAVAVVGIAPVAAAAPQDSASSVNTSDWPKAYRTSVTHEANGRVVFVAGLPSAGSSTGQVDWVIDGEPLVIPGGMLSTAFAGDRPSPAPMGWVVLGTTDAWMQMQFGDGPHEVKACFIDTGMCSRPAVL